MIALNDEIEQLAWLLAERSGKTPAEVIRQALEERARAAGIEVPLPRRRKTPEERVAAIKAISDRCSARPVLDPRTPEEIIGYDEFGIPR